MKNNFKKALKAGFGLLLILSLLLSIVTAFGSTSYTITFNMNYEGSTPIYEDFTHGATVEVFAEALKLNYVRRYNSNGLFYERSTYIIDGWYTDALLTNEYDLNTPVTGIITLYAKWKQVYDIKYFGNSNTGGVVPFDSGIYNMAGITLASANTGNLTRTGYIFVGWIINHSSKGALLGAPGVFYINGNIDLYARWISE